MNLLLEIFLSFAKIGLFTFGGGYAMIPIIENEVINKRDWIKKEDFLTLLTLAQSAPGPISLNTSVFVGYKLSGVKGALSAILGVVIPCFFVMLAVVIAFSFLKDNLFVLAAFKGVRPVVVALMAVPIIKFSKSFGVLGYMVSLCTGFLIWYFNISAVYFIIVSMIVGLLFAVKSVNNAKKGGSI